jgi:hypothetical protein
VAHQQVVMHDEERERYDSDLVKNGISLLAKNVHKTPLSKAERRKAFSI